MTYKFRNQYSIDRLADGINFPVGNGNSDYEECKRWMALDPIKNVVQAADPPTPPTAAELKMTADIAAVKADTVIKTLEGLTDAQIDANFLTNVTTLAQVISLLNRIVKFARTASRRL